MNSDNQEELLPVVDEAGVLIGSATRGECHDGNKRPLHPVVHLHVFNSKGELYLQKRPHWKSIQPDKWDTAVGGHVDLGEDISTSLKREVEEEIGITDYMPKLLCRYVFESARERELVFVYETTYDAEIHPSNELAGGQFWSIKEIKAHLGYEVFTPNFEQEFKRLGYDKRLEKE